MLTYNHLFCVFQPTSLKHHAPKAVTMDMFWGEEMTLLYDPKESFILHMELIHKIHNETVARLVCVT